MPAQNSLKNNSNTKPKRKPQYHIERKKGPFKVHQQRQQKSFANTFALSVRYRFFLSKLIHSNSKTYPTQLMEKNVDISNFGNNFFCAKLKGVFSKVFHRGWCSA